MQYSIYNMEMNKKISFNVMAAAEFHQAVVKSEFFNLVSSMNSLECKLRLIFSFLICRTMGTL